MDVTAVSKGRPPPIPAGAALLGLVDALTTGFPAEPIAERQAVVAELGHAAAERAIGVIATFQMMNRLLDGVGAPVHPSLLELGLELGFERDELPI